MAQRKILKREAQPGHKENNDEFVRSNADSRCAAGACWKHALRNMTQDVTATETMSATNSFVNHDTKSTNKPPPLTKPVRQRQRRKVQENMYVAIDCEMVGVGHRGMNNMLARVSIVNKNCEVLLDKYVKPRAPITDYRTSVSGIRPQDLGEGAEEFSTVQKEVIELLHGKILVGHALRNDLDVLHITHPYVNKRDTSNYKPLSILVSNGHTPSLKRLALAILGLEIQTGEHDSVQDASTAMKLYKCLSTDWEAYIRNQNHYHKTNTRNSSMHHRNN